MENTQYFISSRGEWMICKKVGAETVWAHTGEEIDALVLENRLLHRLLDMRDELYFRFCESGLITGVEE